MMQKKRILLSGLIEYTYHKVMGFKNAKNIWDKIENIYAGDSNFKEANLQIYREKFSNSE